MGLFKDKLMSKISQRDNKTRNIFFDARALQMVGYSQRGIGRHGRSLLKAIPQQIREKVNLTGLIVPTEANLDQSDLKIFDCVSFEFVPKEGDVFFSPAPVNLPDCWRITKYPELLKVGIVHDFIGYDFPGLVKSDSYAKELLKNVRSLNNYDLLLSNSSYTDGRLRAILPDSGPSLITGVVINQTFFEECSAEPEITIPSRYFVVAAGDNPRKNLEVAVEAFGLLRAKDIPKLHLLVVGGYDLAARERVYSNLSDNARAVWNEVRFLPHVSDETLAHVFRKAVATIVPSFIEGFSIPVVETIAAGGLSIVSSCDAHKELIDGPFFDPHDAVSLSLLMSKALDDEWRASQLVLQNGSAQRFSAKRIGEQLWPSILEAKIRPIVAVAQRRIKQDGDKPRILFVTPYPPDASGVATVHAESMPDLLQLADVTVATLTANVRDSSKTQPRVLRPKDIKFSDYDRAFYVIGNSLFHSFVHDLLLENGGETILHDSRLFEFYLATRGGDEVVRMASAIAKRPVTIQEVEDWVRDRRKLIAPMLDEVVAASSRVYVFSKQLEKTLLSTYGCETVLCRIPIHGGIREDMLTDSRRRLARQAVGFSSDFTHICTFGSVDLTKGCWEAVYAIDQISQYGKNVKLHFVGFAESALMEKIANYAENVGISDSIVFHGAVDTDHYIDFLLSADIGMQFRREKFGQTSGALTELIAAGVCTIANETLADAHDAPGYVIRVPDALEPMNIALSVLGLMETKNTAAGNSEERQRHVYGRTWATFAKELLQ